jgi:hypothetical protein
MSCKICPVIRQFGMNWLLWLDKTGNTFLLGNPNETISRRTARAAAAGEKWAQKACKALSFVLGHDHCQYALEPGSAATEIWAWSNNFSQPDLTTPAAGDTY